MSLPVGNFHADVARIFLGSGKRHLLMQKKESLKPNRENSGSIRFESHSDYWGINWGLECDENELSN